MLRAEESTRSGPETDRKDEVTSQRGPRAEETAGRLIARCGIQAVNAAERAICGTGAVHRATTAEGLALAGRRAATLLEDAPSAEPPGTAATTAPWVHHRLRPGQPGFGGGMAFELVASTAQEAVDHCLVAHRLAAHLMRPGLCTADRLSIAGPQLVRLPRRETIDGLLDDSDSAGRQVQSRPAVEEIIAAAEEAFQSVSDSTGRQVGLLAPYRMEGAEVALVASGASSHRSMEVADALREAGIACGVVSVNLVLPFPTEALRSSLQGMRRVAVVLPPASPLERDQFNARVGGALDETHDRGSVVLDGEPGLPAALAQALGLAEDRRQAAESALQSRQEDERSVVLGAAPAGCWSDQFLLDVAALMGSLGHLDLHCPETSLNYASTLAVGRKTFDDSTSGTIDLLLLPEASLLGAARGLLGAMKDGGTLLLASSGPSQAGAVNALGAPMLQEIASRGIHLKWIDTADLHDRSDTPEDARTRLLGAFIAADESVASIVGQTDLVPALGEPGIATGLIREGAEALRDLDTDAPLPDTDLRPGRTLPLMPEAPEADPSDTWRDALREFHLSGRGAWSRAEPLPSLALRPAGLSMLASPEWLWKLYPFVLMPDGTTRSFSALVSEIVDSAEAVGKPLDVVAKYRARLARVVSRVLRSRIDGKAFGEIMDETVRVFVSGFEISETAATELDAELDRFKKALPESAELIDIDERTLLRFLTEALGRERGSRRFTFLEEVKTLAVRLRELLQIDDALTPQGSAPEAIAASLGEGSGIRIDPTALSRNFPTQRGSKRLPEERRKRIERNLAILEGYVERSASEPECVLVHPGLLSDETPLPAARMIVHPEALEAAVGLFDGVAGRMTDVVRAVRIARLEQRGDYDAERHDPVLERFDWQAFTAAELLLIPAVVVIETGERLRGDSLSAFSVVLRSGRPVQVLVVDETRGVAAGETFEALAGYHPGLGYLAVAHREALVIQGTLAHPSELIRGLSRMASAVTPAVSVVSVPTWRAPAHPWLQLAAMHFGRGAPLFRYDPSAGTTWAERFDLSENPQPELMWTLPEVSCIDGSGAERLLGEPFTFAHAAALDPVYRPHFRVVPPEGWNDDQLMVSEYLAVSDKQRLHGVPYIWVVDDEGVLARAVMTRELAFACRDRMRAWRILQELGGANNEYARRAAGRAREDALAEAETERINLEAAHAAALDETRRTAAGEAMDRLAAVLTSEDALAAMAGSGLSVARAEPVEAPPASPAESLAPAESAPEVVEEEEAVSFSDPYIDAMLCTTCNECTNLNGRMFQYNENRQAFVADAAAGTFAELVKAAEKCPARCIHPGAPRDGDDTVTDDLIARAAKFN